MIDWQYVWKCHVPVTSDVHDVADTNLTYT